MIEAKAVSKSFDGFLALNDLDMTVPKGSIYGLVGPNGAGKSTILRHLCGVYRPDSGVITIEGQPVYENPAIKERMVVIPDDVYYYGSASVREMMKFYRGMYPTFSMERFEKLAEAFPDGVQPGLPQGMEVLHQSQLGRVYTYIVRGRAEEVQQQVEAIHPLFVEALPLSLEEIFIYEMGGNDYAVRDIVL